MKTRLISLVILIIILAIITGATDSFRKLIPEAPWNTTTPPVVVPPDVPVACTMDAKMCPDGSYVGRIPPSCQFAACPTSTSTPINDGNIFIKASINNNVSGDGISITVRELLEDSRCPIDVVCIQAGTVRVRVNLQSVASTSEQTFILGQPVNTEAGIVTLNDVEPIARAGNNVKISDYRFIFKVTKTSTPQAI